MLYLVSFSLLSNGKFVCPVGCLMGLLVRLLLQLLIKVCFGLKFFAVCTTKYWIVDIIMLFYFAGYDVFLGNFRGLASREHVDKNISSRQ